MAVALALFGVVAATAAWLPFGIRSDSREVFSRNWLRAWVHKDGEWYLRIARFGYLRRPGHFQSASFFPGYPLLVRGVHLLGPSNIAAGVFITLGCGLAAALLFHRWLRTRCSPGAASTAVLTLLLFPFAFYLFGAMYADALFLACALGAFLAMERGRPLVAGGLAAIATASRPVGIAVVVGLAILAWEQATLDPEKRRDKKVARRAMLAPAIGACGLVTYASYLWIHVGDPFAFIAGERAWHQQPGIETLLKFALIHHILHEHATFTTMAPLLIHPLIAIGAIALVPRVFRRYGRAYGWYTLIVLGMPIVFTKDFFGMGRYALAAFALFAIVGEWLHDRPRARTLILIASAALLILLTSWYTRLIYVA